MNSTHGSGSQGSELPGGAGVRAGLQDPTLQVALKPAGGDVA